MLLQSLVELELRVLWVRSKELFFTAWLIYNFSSEMTMPKWRTGLKMLQTMSVIYFVTYGIYYESKWYTGEIRE